MSDDWALKAARVIHLQFDLDRIAPQDTSVYAIQDIILVHCPVRPDIIYIPVPRCETCSYWYPWERDKGNCLMAENIRDDGQRSRVESSGMLTNKNFGCVEWKEKT